MTRLVCASAVAAALMAAPASATTIFDLSPDNNVTNRASDSGPGQGVTVSTTTVIDGMAMDIAMPNGGDFKYMIWDDTNSTLLFSQTKSIGASATPSFVASDPFSFTLNAGHTYWFGVIGDNDLNVGFIFPTVPYSANGLTALMSGNSNYSNFANPTFDGTAAAEIGLRLDGTQVPEPASLLLLGSGVAALARKRMIRR